MILRGLKQAAASVKRELRVYQIVRRDPRTPWPAKALLAAAIAYFISPIDIIPDFIPVIGHLDDAVIVPLLVVLALRMVPAAVIQDAKRKCLDAPDDAPLA